ncbi:CHAT domain-containing protein [candidate division KSB1 bacterium]|nr:CHAT domain-containing protein [candidate division KSB1 bacterium]
MRRHISKIILLFFPVLLYAETVMPNSTSAGQYAEYYRLLESIRDKSAASRLRVLEDYLKQHPEFERVYKKILEHYQSADDLDGAEFFFNTIKTNPAGYHNSMWALACMYSRQKQYERALQAFHTALRAGTPSPDLLKDYADFISDSPAKPSRRDTLFFSDLNNESKTLFYAFLDFRQQNYPGAFTKLTLLTHSKSDKLPVLYLYGLCLMQINRLAGADSVFVAGLEISKQVKDREYEILFTCAQGTLQLNKTSYDEAIRFFRSALDRALGIKDIRSLLFIYENMGALFYKLGEYALVIYYFDEALKIAEQNKQSKRVGTFIFYKALSRYKLQQYSQALTLYDNCEKIARISGDIELLINIYLGRGSLYKNLFQLELAEREYKKAHVLTEKAKNPVLNRQTIINQANNLIALNDLAESRKLFHQVIDQFTDTWEYESKAYCQAQIARTYMLEKNYSRARDYYTRARQTLDIIENKFLSAWYLLMEAKCDIRCGRFDTALVKLDTVINRGYRQNSDYILRNALTTEGWAYEEMGYVDQAISWYKKSVKYIEIPRSEIEAETLRIGYFSDNYQVYRGLARCYREKYLQNADPVYLDSLFYYEEKHRGRALKDNLYAEKTKSDPGGGNDNYLSACRNLQKTQYRLRQQAGTSRTTEQWDELMAGLEAAKYELISQKLQISDSLHRDIGVSASQPAISLSDIRRHLKKHDCGLLMYHIDEKGSFVLAATGDTSALVSLNITPESLQLQVDSLITPLRNITEESAGNVPFRAVTAYQLYNILFKPIREQFPLPERLFIIPEGVLLNLPFEVLLLGKPEKAVYAPVDDPDYAEYFLLQKHSIFYSSTSAIFRDKKKSLLPKKQLLVFANPYTRIVESADKMLQFRFRTGWRFEPLPFADAEGKNIKNIAPAAHIYSRENASEQTFMDRAPHYDVLHIASHAFVDTSFDDFSGLILASGEDSTEDGILMGYEINNLKLDNDLVTLSACETGRGKNIKAEGIMGLPRLFLGAGAHSVLLSLWKVDDRFTSFLLPEFYRYYFKEKLTKSDALAKAKRDFINWPGHSGADMFYQHPFYWASFTLYGDPGPARHSPPVSLYLLEGFGLLFIVGGGFWVRKRGKAAKNISRYYP